MKVLSGEAAANARRASAKASALASGQPSGDDAQTSTLDLQIIHPDAPFRLAGRTLTLREYGHIEGLRLLAWARPFVDGLYALVAREAGVQPTLTEIRFLRAEHADLVRDMTAQALTTPGEVLANALPEREELAAWIERLGDQDGQALLAVWWQVNVHFFFRRCFERALEAAASAKPSGGRASTTN